MIKKLLICLLLSILVFVPNKVYAASLTDKDLSVTCIYNDGKAIIKNYDTLAETRYASIQEYPAKNSMKIEYNVSNYRLLGLKKKFFDIGNVDDNPTNGYSLAVASELNYSCPNTFRRWLVEEYNEAYSIRQLSLVYYPDTTLNLKEDYNDECGDLDNRVYCFLKMNNKTGAFANKEKNVTVINIGTTASQQLKLVAERVNVISNQNPDRSFVYVYKAKQASGNNKYITIDIYGEYNKLEDYDKNKYYLNDGKNTTSLDSEPQDEEPEKKGQLIALKRALTIQKEDKITAPYICVKLSSQELSSTEGANEYEFSNPRHYAQKGSKNQACPAGYSKYEYSHTSYAEAEGGDITQICDEIPNTVNVLKKVLSYIQIIMPALVIVYTGIDIGKIIVAGTIEEELPKRRKSIIIRFIVLLAFFFIPLIIKVVLGELYGNKIGGIECVTESSTENEDDNDDETEESEETVKNEEDD